MYAPTVTIFATGITLSLVGIFQDDGGDLSRAGILIAFASLPPLCYWQTQRAHDDVENQVADAHAAGYRLGLEHVAKGLLKRNAAPPDGGEHVDQVEQCADQATHRAANGAAGPVVPDNVRPLRLVQPDHDERKIV
jgi:hypothetical protein